MPYSDPDRQREFNREWVAKRRREWFADKACVRCGSNEDLQLDHVDPKLKVDHRIWSWSKERRDAETAKCQVLCYPCHITKTITAGEGGGRKLTFAEVQTIRDLYGKGGLTQKALADQFGIGRTQVSKLVRIERRRYR